MLHRYFLKSTFVFQLWISGFIYVRTCSIDIGYGIGKNPETQLLQSHQQLCMYICMYTATYVRR